MENRRTNKHKVLKLKDGTDIIGRVVGIDKGGLIIDTPMVYEMTPIFDAKGRIKYFTISFRKWFEFAKTQRYYFPKEYIVAHSDPERDLVRDYIRARKANITFQKLKDMEEESEKDSDSEATERQLDSLLMEDIMNKIVEDIVKDAESFGMKNVSGSDSPKKFGERGGTHDEFWRGFPIL